MIRPLLLALPLLYCLSIERFVNLPPAGGQDSNVIEHKLDGNAAEWPAAAFHSDEETHIRYAFDNDATDLYVLMEVNDRAEQFKMIRMGMRMFVDLKAKKKENMGVEFPVKRDMSAGSGGNRNPDEGGEEGGERRRPDPKEMRERMAALYMVSMKIFGFTAIDEPKEIGLTMFNTVNLAFNWDDSDRLTLEYKIPLNMIDDPKTLINKEISIGWKINGVEAPAGAGGSGFGGAGGGFSGGGRGGGGGRPGGGRMPAPTTSNGGNDSDRQQQFDKMRKEQSIWAHYTFHIDPGTKGF